MKTVFAAMILLLGSQCFAQVKFENARIFTPLKGSDMTAGYVTIKNEGAAEVEVALKSVEKFKAAETHETVEKNGKMGMEKVDAFKIPAGQSIELKPGGKHMMLFNPAADIKEGSSLKAIFVVDHKKEESVAFKVVPRSASSEEHHHH
jgi:copper(I)-binding protein